MYDSTNPTYGEPNSERIEAFLLNLWIVPISLTFLDELLGCVLGNELTSTLEDELGLSMFVLLGFLNLDSNNIA